MGRSRERAVRGRKSCSRRVVSNEQQPCACCARKTTCNKIELRADVELTSSSSSRQPQPHQLRVEALHHRRDLPDARLPRLRAARALPHLHVILARVVPPQLYELIQSAEVAVPHPRQRAQFFLRVVPYERTSGWS